MLNSEVVSHTNLKMNMFVENKIYDMKKFIVYGLILFAIITNSNRVFAQAKGFGLGIVLGAPTGISMKSWVSHTGAVDGAVGWGYENGGFIHVHADYLVHNFKLISVNQGQLPLYFGIGAKLVFANEPIFGARIPLGINYIFGDAPLDLFGEIVPGLNLIPSTDFDLEGGIGIRYWFK